MNRSLKLTRIYSLGNYQNLQLTNEINDIPEELAVDHDLITGLTKLQLVETEMQYNYYCMLRTKTSKVATLEEIQNILEEERTETITALFDNENFNTYIEKLMKEKKDV